MRMKPEPAKMPTNKTNKEHCSASKKELSRIGRKLRGGGLRCRLWRRRSMRGETSCRC